MAPNKSRILLLLLAAITAGWTVACAQTRILCFGDSITAGLDLDEPVTSVGGPDDGYLPHLSSWLNASWGPVTLLNRGLLGDTTASGKQRIQSTLAATSPELVLVMIGTNDVNAIWRAGGVGLNQAIGNVDAILSSITAFGAEPILATIPPRRGAISDPDNAVTRSFNSNLRGSASGRGIRLVDQEANFNDHFIREVYSDPLHPSYAGYQLMAEPFAAVIADAAPSSIDLVAPFSILTDPEPFTWTASPAGGIKLVLIDFGTGMDLGTLQMTVDGQPVEPVVTGGPDSANLDYQPDTAWVFGQTVAVSVSIDDRATPVNSMSLEYSFTVSAGNGTAGDLDGSGRIDGADLVILAVAFGSSTGDSRYRAVADVDLNGVVDGNDLAFISSQFGMML